MKPVVALAQSILGPKYPDNSFDAVVLFKSFLDITGEKEDFYEVEVNVERVAANNRSYLVAYANIRTESFDNLMEQFKETIKDQLIEYRDNVSKEDG